jgi:hypothetical protein
VGLHHLDDVLDEVLAPVLADFFTRDRAAPS